MKVAKILGMGVAMLALAACGGKQEGSAPPNFKGIDYPDWVMKGSGAFGGEEGRVFYGVGVNTGVKNPALARTNADNRARSELGKVFETYTASLMKDYMASTSAGDLSASSEEQHIENVIKTFSAQTLSMVMIVDHWFHPTDGSIYALARLDLGAFQDNLAKMKELSSEVRDYVRKNAERAHMDLEAEEAKRQ